MAQAIEQVKSEQQGALQVREQVNQIQHLMKDVLQEGTHYGKVPGCGDKPTLLQPGAEKIALMFGFTPTYDVQREDLGGNHREYTVNCTLADRKTGEAVGGGMGSCSTLESKYRYRWTGYGNNRQRVENPDVADQWNTVLKMAKKRAFVDAVKSTTAASDIFTQDIEDLPSGYEPQAAQVAQAVTMATEAQLGEINQRVNRFAEMTGRKPYEVTDAVRNAKSVREAGYNFGDEYTEAVAVAMIGILDKWLAAKEAEQPAEAEAVEAVVESSEPSPELKAAQDKAKAALDAQKREEEAAMADDDIPF